jgi:hypothetical protein
MNGTTFAHVARLGVPVEELAESALHGANQPAGVVAVIDDSSEAAAGTDTVAAPPPTAFSRAIDQQETMPPQPQFGQTYVVLGDQYQKMGRPEHAAATWLMGAQRFPGHLEIQQRIRGN